MLKPINQKIGDFNRCVHMKNASSRHLPLLWAVFNKEVDFVIEGDDKKSGEIIDNNFDQ